MPCHAPSGKQMPWRTASGRTVPWRSASELSRLRLKRPERLVRPDAKDAIFFFPDVSPALVTSRDHHSGTSPSDSDTSKNSDDESEGESEIFDPMAVLHSDINPGLSTFLQISGEHVNVTDEMLARIEEMVATEWEADRQVIAGIIETEDAWEEITRCALRLGRLSFTGAAAYVIQGLVAE